MPMWGHSIRIEPIVTTVRGIATRAPLVPWLSSGTFAHKAVDTEFGGLLTRGGQPPLFHYG
ncbi:hypothetical protein AB7179_11440 [Providencia manganoxydans]|nr:hypothetical protein [Providencia sp. 2023EL-00965]MDW7590897.1 hypothetical protein [Providencia sp. 2023EL-00965]